MEKNSWQRTWVRTVTTVLTASVMVLIFFFSTEDADRSDRTSGVLAERVIDLFYPEYELSTPEQQKEIYDSVQHIVRKAAHFTEYLILGFMLRCCLESWFGRKKWLIPAAWATGTGYAGTDELHQMLIDGRSGQWSDVLLDSSGVLTGVLLASIVIFMIYRRNALRKDS